MAAPDVVVVGGGLIGLLTAAELAERGMRVVLLEKDDIGFEQSGRSVAAVNLPGGKPSDGPRSMLRASSEAWSTFEDRWSCEIDLNVEGWHIVVTDADDSAWIETDRSTWQETAGYPRSETLAAAEARERFPQLEGPFIAMDVRPGGHVDAMMVMSGMRNAALRLGVQVRCGVVVTGFETAGQAVTAVRTNEGPVRCGATVVAAGVWSPQLCDLLGLHIPMQRVRAPAVVTGPVPSGTIPGFLRAPTFGARQNRNGTVRITGGYRYSAMLHDVSFRDVRDLRLWGPVFWQNRKDVSLRLSLETLRSDVRGTFTRFRQGEHAAVAPQGYDPPASPRDRRSQLRDLGELVPAVRGARVHHSFSGVIDLVPDLQPVIGRIPELENAYVSTGFSGHGYMYGPGACQALARLIVQGDAGVDLHRYRPERLGEKLKMREQIF